MKLLYLNHNVAGTGTYFRALHFGRQMAARGHDVTLVTTSRTNRLSFSEREIDGVRQLEAPDLWSGPARTGWDPYNTLRRILRVRRLDVDLVHGFDGRPAVSLPAFYAARQSGAAFLIDWADWWGRGGHIQQRSGWPVRTFFGPLETWFEEAFRTVADANTVISSALHDRVLGLGVEPRRTLRLPQGCDPSWTVRGDRAAARSLLGVPAGEPLLVHLGNLTSVDMEFLAASLRRVRLRLPGTRLVLVGQPKPRIPADLAHAGAIRVTGYLDNAIKNAWLAASDLCVIAMPDTLGHRGRWPSKINDYFCAGRATVMTDVSDAAAFVRDRGLGWVTAPHAQAFGEGILAALQDPAEAAAAGCRAHSVAEQELHWRALADRLAHLYETVLQEKPAPQPGMRTDLATPQLSPEHRGLG